MYALSQYHKRHDYEDVDEGSHPPRVPVCHPQEDDITNANPSVTTKEHQAHRRHHSHGHEKSANKKHHVHRKHHRHHSDGHKKSETAVSKSSYHPPAAQTDTIVSNKAPSSDGGVAMSTMTSGAKQSFVRSSYDEKREEARDYDEKQEESILSTVTYSNEAAIMSKPGTIAIGPTAVRRPGMDEENQLYVSNVSDNANQQYSGVNQSMQAGNGTPTSTQEPIEAELQDNSESKHSCTLEAPEKKEPQPTQAIRSHGTGMGKGKKHMHILFGTIALELLIISLF